MADQTDNGGFSDNSSDLSLGQVVGHIGITLDQSQLEAEIKRFEAEFPTHLKRISAIVIQEFQAVQRAVGSGSQTITDFREFLKELGDATDLDQLSTRTRGIVEGATARIATQIGAQSKTVLKRIGAEVLDGFNLAATEMSEKMAGHITANVTGAADLAGKKVKEVLSEGLGHVGTVYTDFLSALRQNSSALVSGLSSSANAQADIQNKALSVQAAGIQRRKQLLQQEEQLLGSQKRIRADIKELRSFAQDVADEPDLSGLEGQRLLAFHTQLRTRINALQLEKDQNNNPRSLSVPFFEASDVEGSVKGIHDALFRLVELSSDTVHELNAVRAEFKALASLDPTTELNRGLEETVTLMHEVGAQERAVRNLEDLGTRLANLQRFVKSGTVKPAIAQAELNLMLHAASGDLAQSNLRGTNTQGGTVPLRLPAQTKLADLDALIARVNGSEGLIVQAERREVQLGAALGKSTRSAAKLAESEGIAGHELALWGESQAAVLNTVSRFTKATDDIEDQLGARMGKALQALVLSGGSVASLEANLVAARSALPRARSADAAGQARLKNLREELTTADPLRASELRKVLQGDDSASTKRKQQGLIFNAELSARLRFKIEGQIRTLSDAIDLALEFNPQELGISDVPDNRESTAAAKLRVRRVLETGRREALREANLARSGIGSQSSQADVFDQFAQEQEDFNNDIRRQRAAGVRRIGVESAAASNDREAQARRLRRGGSGVRAQSPLDQAAGDLTQDVASFRLIGDKLTAQQAILQTDTKKMQDQSRILKEQDALVAQQVSLASRIKARALLLSSSGRPTDIPADVAAAISRLETLRPTLPAGAGDPRAVLRQALARVGARGKVDDPSLDLLRFVGLLEAQIEKGSKGVNIGGVPAGNALRQIATEIGQGKAPGNATQRKAGDPGVFGSTMQTLFDDLNRQTSDEILGIRGLGDVLVDLRSVRSRIARLMETSSSNATDRLVRVLEEDPSTRGAADGLRKAAAQVTKAREALSGAERRGAEPDVIEGFRTYLASSEGLKERLKVLAKEALSARGGALTESDLADLSRSKQEEATLASQFKEAQARLKIFGGRGELRQFIEHALGVDPAFLRVLSTAREGSVVASQLEGQIADLADRAQRDTPIQRQTTPKKDKVDTSIKGSLEVRRAAYKKVASDFVHAFAEDRDLVARLMLFEQQISDEVMLAAEAATHAVDPNTGEIGSAEADRTHRTLQSVHAAKKFLNLGAQPGKTTAIFAKLQEEFTKLQGEGVAAPDEIPNEGNIIRELSKLGGMADDLIQDAVLGHIHEQMVFLERDGFNAVRAAARRRALVRPNIAQSLDTPNNLGLARQVGEGSSLAQVVPTFKLEPLFPQPTTVQNIESIRLQHSRELERGAQAKELRILLDRNEREQEAVAAYFRVTGRNMEGWIDVATQVDTALLSTLVPGAAIAPPTLPISALRARLDEVASRRRTSLIVEQVGGALKGAAPIPASENIQLAAEQAQAAQQAEESALERTARLTHTFRSLWVKELEALRAGADQGAGAVARMAKLEENLSPSGTSQFLSALDAQGVAGLKAILDKRSATEGAEKAKVVQASRLAIIGSTSLGHHIGALGSLVDEALKSAGVELASFDQIVLDTSRASGLGNKLKTVLSGKTKGVKTIEAVFDTPTSATRQSAGLEKSAQLANEAKAVIALYDGLDEEVALDIGAMLRAGREVHVSIVKEGKIIRQATVEDLNRIRDIDLSKTHDYGVQAARARVREFPAGTTGLPKPVAVGPPVIFQEEFSKALLSGSQGLAGRAQVNIGENIAEGFVGSFVHALDGKQVRIAAAMLDIVADIETTWGIHSPSTVTKRIGAFVAEGFKVGFQGYDLGGKIEALARDEIRQLQKIGNTGEDPAPFIKELGDRMIAEIAAQRARIHTLTSATGVVSLDGLLGLDQARETIHRLTGAERAVPQSLLKRIGVTPLTQQGPQLAQKLPDTNPIPAVIEAEQEEVARFILAAQRGVVNAMKVDATIVRAAREQLNDFINSPRGDASNAQRISAANALHRIDKSLGDLGAVGDEAIDATLLSIAQTAAETAKKIIPKGNQPRPRPKSGGTPPGGALPGLGGDEEEEVKFSKHIELLVERAITLGFQEGVHHTDIAATLAAGFVGFRDQLRQVAGRGVVDIDEGIAGGLKEALLRIEAEIGLAQTRLTKTTDSGTHDLISRGLTQLREARALLKEEEAKLISTPPVTPGEFDRAIDVSIAAGKAAAKQRDAVREEARKSTLLLIKGEAVTNVVKAQEALHTLLEEQRRLEAAFEASRSPEMLIKIRSAANEVAEKIKLAEKAYKGANTELERLVKKEETLAGSAKGPEGRVASERLIKEQLDLATATRVAEENVDKVLTVQIGKREKLNSLMKLGLAGAAATATVAAAVIAPPIAGAALLGGGALLVAKDQDRSTRALLETKVQAVALREKLAALVKEQADLEGSVDKSGKATKKQLETWNAYNKVIKSTQAEVNSLEKTQKKLETNIGRGILGAIPILNHFRQEANDTGESMERVNRSASGLSKFSNLRSGIIGGLVGSATLRATNVLQGAFSNLGDSLVGFNARIEQARTGIQVFVQDSSKTQKLLDDLVGFATSTPFDLPDILTATKRLLAMGIAANEVIPTFRDLGGAVAAVGGDKDTLNRVILAYGQIRAKSVLMSQDLRQLAEAGIPAFQILQKQLHLTGAQVFDIGRQHISAAQGVAALRKGFQEMYSASTAAQLQTFNGRAANLRDILSILLGRIGAPLTDQLTIFMRDLANVLAEPGTIKAAEEFGKAIGNMAQNIRLFLTSGREGLLEFFRSIPTLITNVGTALKEFEVYVSTFRFNLNPFDGAFLLDPGIGPKIAEEMSHELEKVKAEVQAKNEKSAKFADIAIDATLSVETVQMDISRAKPIVDQTTKTALQNLADFKDNVVDVSVRVGDMQLDGTKAKVAIIGEDEIVRKLGTEQADALNNWLDAVSANLVDDAAAGRPVAHIMAQFREQFLVEIAKLGTGATMEQAKAAGKRIMSALSQDKSFFDDEEILKLAGAYLELGVDQKISYDLGIKIRDANTANKRASDSETQGIKKQKDALDDLSTARDKDKKTTQDRLDAIGREGTAIEHALRLQDHTFDRQEKAQKAATVAFHDTMDPVLENVKTLHQEAADAITNLTEAHQRSNRVIQADITAREGRVATLKASQQADLDSFDAIISQQGRITRDLTDQKAIAEGSFASKIDLATAAEKRQASVIKDATLDQREKVRAQQDEIDRIDDKYRLELRALGIPLGKTQGELREAERKNNREQLDFAQQILIARQHGNTDEVKRLTEAREQARINFENSVDAKRAQAQVEQDAVDALKAQVDEQQKAAKDALDDLNRNGARRQDVLAREAETITANKDAVIADRDAVTSSYDAKIKVAEAFATLLGRSKEDLATLQKGELAGPETALASLKTQFANLQLFQAKQVDIAQDAEKAAQAVLTTQQATFDAFFKEQDRKLAAIGAEKDRVDQAAQDRQFDLDTEKITLSDIEDAKQLAYEKRIAPLNDELTHLTRIHEQNDLIRAADLQRTTDQKTQTDDRISDLDREIARLKNVEDSQKRIAANALAAEKESQAANVKSPEQSGQETQSQLNRILLSKEGGASATRGEGKTDILGGLAARLSEAQVALVRGDKDALTKYEAVLKEIAIIADHMSIVLTPQELVKITFPDDPLKMQVGIDPDVIQLLAAITIARVPGISSRDKDQAVAQVGAVLRRSDLVAKLRTALLGDGTLDGSAAIKADLETAFNSLNALFPAAAGVRATAVGDALKTAIGGVDAGGNIDLKALAAQVELETQAAAAGNNGSKEMKDAALAHQIAAQNLIDAARFLQGGSKTEDQATFEKAVDVLSAALGTSPKEGLASGALSSNSGGILPGLQAVSQLDNDRTLNELKDRLKDNTTLQQVVASMLADSGTWALIFEKVDPKKNGDLLAELHKGFEDLLSTDAGKAKLQAEIKRVPGYWKALIDQMGLLTDDKLAPILKQFLLNAGDTGQQIGPQLSGGVVSGSTSLQNTVADRVINPTEKQLASLPKSALETGIKLVGPDGLGFIGSTQSVATTASNGAEVSRVTIEALNAGLGVGSGLNEFGKAAQNLIGPNGLSYMSDGKGGLVLVNGAAVEVGTTLYKTLVAELGIGKDNKFKTVADALLSENGLGWIASPDGKKQLSVTVAKAGPTLDAAIAAILVPGPLAGPASKTLGTALGGNIIGSVNEALQAEWDQVDAMVARLFGQSLDKAAVKARNFVEVPIGPPGPPAKQIGPIGPPAPPKAGPPTPVIGSPTGGAFATEGAAFGANETQFGATQKHTGVDIVALRGQTIFSISDGIVVFVGGATQEIKERDPAGGLGLYIKIASTIGGKKVLVVYGHLSKALPGITVAKVVHRGDPIALAGTTGNSTNPHLHFEVEDDKGTPIDPLPFLPKQGSLVGTGGSAIPVGAVGVSGGLPGSPGSIPGSEPGTSLPNDKRALALQLIHGLVEGVQAAGGDFNVVLDAFFSGASSLTEEQISKFSGSARAQMKQAFETLRLTLSLIGATSPEALRSALQDAGVAAPTADITTRFQNEMFPDGLPKLMVNGFMAGYDEAAIQAAWDTFWARHPGLKDATFRAQLRGAHPEAAASEGIAAVVSDRTLIPDLVKLVQDNKDNGSIAHFLETLRSADDKTTLREVLNSLLLTPGDPVSDQILKIIQTLGSSLDAISVGQFKGVLGANPAELERQQALAGLKSSGSQDFVARLLDVLKTPGLTPDTETLAQFFKSVGDVPTTPEGKQLREFLIKAFGDKSIAELRTLFLDEAGALQGSLVDSVSTQAGVRNISPEAAAAAATIRRLALQGRINAAGTTDGGLTNILSELRALPAGSTIQNLLAKFVGQESDGSPTGVLLAYLRKLAVEQPDLNVADIQGLLFGGAGFDPVTQVDATKDNTDALDANTAALLGAATPEEIDVWTQILREHRETAAKLVDTAEKVVAVAGEVAGAGPSGTNVPGTVPLGTALPSVSAPIVPDTRTEAQKAIDDAKAKLIAAQAKVDQLSGDLELAYGKHDQLAMARIDALLRDAVLARDNAAQAVASLEGAGKIGEADARLEVDKHDLEVTVHKDRLKLAELESAGKRDEANVVRRRLRAEEEALGDLKKQVAAKEAAVASQQAAANAPQPAGDASGAVPPGVPPEVWSGILDRLRNPSLIGAPNGSGITITNNISSTDPDEAAKEVAKRQIWAMRGAGDSVPV